MSSFFIRLFAKNAEGDTYSFNRTVEAESFDDLMENKIGEFEEGMDSPAAKDFCGEDGSKLTEVEVKLKKMD